MPRKKQSERSKAQRATYKALYGGKPKCRCPFCSSHMIEKLPGGVVWDCQKCGQAFNDPSYMGTGTTSVQKEKPK